MVRGSISAVAVSFVPRRADVCLNPNGANPDRQGRVERVEADLELDTRRTQDLVEAAFSTSSRCFGNGAKKVKILVVNS